MNKILLLLSLLFSIATVSGQNTWVAQRVLVWNKAMVNAGDGQSETPAFKGAVYLSADGLPYFIYRASVASTGTVQAELRNVVYAPITISDPEIQKKIPVNPLLLTSVTEERGKYAANVRFIPIRRAGNGFEKIVSFELSLRLDASPRLAPRGTLNTAVSVLSDGAVYKISVAETGMHTLDYNFFKTDLGLNPDAIDPATIKIYGNGGGIPPEPNSADRPDDLIENNIQFVDANANNKFDAGDYFLFYATGPDKRYYDATQKIFYQPKNIYDAHSYYFIKIGSGNGARVGDRANGVGGGYTVTVFDDFARFEEVKFNVLNSRRDGAGTGSGKTWVGDYFNENGRSRTYPRLFSFPNLSPGEPARIDAELVGSSASPTTFSVTVAGKTFNGDIVASDPTNLDDVFAAAGDITGSFLPASDNMDVTVDYQKNAGGVFEGWLHFIQINCRRLLKMTGNELAFREIGSIGKSSATYIMSGADANTVVWDVSVPQKPLNQQISLNGSELRFTVAPNGLPEFVAFQKGQAFRRPVSIGKLAAQNLHALNDVDMLIVYHNNFAAATQQLSDFRKNHSGLKVATAEISAVYNEFSSGGQDPTAIRDLARMLNQRSGRFKFLLLMGDGSFDYRGVYSAKQSQPSHFIPPYETDRSFDPIESFPSDDYFGLLSDDEGADLQGDLDISVGRIPCKTAAEANAVVNKMVAYESSPASLGDWRNRVLFMSDMGDSNLHVEAADEVATETAPFKNLNVDKLYADAFHVEVSAGGSRVPAMHDAIGADFDKGLLTVCYLGHGGPNGLSQKRFLEKSDIIAFTNFNKLPLFITATCAFSGYDNVIAASAGETAILNPQGGAIALFSTVRSVYASSNQVLTSAVVDILYNKSGGGGQPIGDVLRAAKNASATGSNGRKFTLLGDPALRLALPRYGVSTTKINGHAVGAQNQDTLRALQRATVEGVVTGDNGQPLTSFNGKVYATVYDKAQTARTLGQTIGGDQNSPKDFTIQRNTLFKGVATARNGVFSFSFVVPKDIDYNFGSGKISYYADDGAQTDAAGAFDRFIIGGTDPTATANTNPPVVRVFLNDSSFVSGGTTNAKPILLVRVNSDNGVNIAGTSIGHDLTATLDDGKSPIVLNNFFEAAQDNYKSGTAKYNLTGLAPGKHTLRVKVWDVNNKSAEAYTEFYVSSGSNNSIAHLLNYPNPFTTHTQFQFVHNLASQRVRVRVNIFTVSGRIVKTIDQDADSNGGFVGGLDWDGRDDYGGGLARGVYLYQVKIAGLDGATGQKTESGFEKLVILK